MSSKPTVFDAHYPDTNEYDGSVATAHQFLQGNNPELYQDTETAHSDKALYDTPVGAKYKPVSAGQKMGAMVSQMNTFINFDQANQLEAARKSDRAMEVSDSQLIDAVPYEFHSLLLNENYEHGGVAAITLRDQIIEDVKNNTINDNLEWYETLGYGVAQALVDPTTYIGGAGGVQVGAQVSKVAAKGSRLLGKSMPKEADTLLRYGSAAVVEAAATNAPRLGGDHTYTVEDYHADLVVDTLLGTGLVYGGSKLFDKYSSYTSQASIRKQAASENIENMKREMETGQADVADVLPDEVVNYEAKPDIVDYRAQVDDSHQQFTPTKGDVTNQVEATLEYPQFKMDNDNQWMGMRMRELATQIDGMKKFVNKTQLIKAINHPAHRNPTRTNIADLTRVMDNVMIEARDAVAKQVELETGDTLKYPNRPATLASQKFAHNGVMSVFADKLDKLGPRLKAKDQESGRGGVNHLMREQYSKLRTLNETVKQKKTMFELGQHPVFTEATDANYHDFRVKLEQAIAKGEADVRRSKSPQDGSTPKSVEMSKVLDKVESERVRLHSGRARLAKSDKFETISYYKDQSEPYLKAGDYKHQTNPLKATIDLSKKAETIIQAESKDMAKKVQGSDEIPMDDITREVNNLKMLQQDAADEAPIKDLDLSTGVLQSAEDSAEAVIANSKVAKEVGDSLLRKSFNKMSGMLADYHGSGEHKVYKGLLTPSNIKQWAARAVSQWGGVTKDLATKFIETDNPALNFIGTHMTEMGRGYGGDIMRKHTAGVIREAEYMRSISKIMPSYDKAVKEYAASKGSKAVGQMMAAVSTGGRNKLQDEFAQKFMLYMNDMRLKKPLPDEPVIAKFAKDWDDYMRHNYGTLVDNKIAGFTGDNYINHYVPQVWHIKHAQRLIRENKEAVFDALVKGIRTEHPFQDAEALMAWLTKSGDDYDGYLATNDARSIERLNIDWSAESDGVRILDLLETDTRRIATNYSNRTAGWAGVSKASGHQITSYTDMSALKLAAYNHKESVEDAMLVDDVFDSLFGRPVQGGLQDWQRSLKSATVLTKLGGLGSAQLIETGTVATRAVMESMGDPKFMKKLLKDMSPEETAADLKELQALTGNNWDYHLINVEAEYYTDYDLANTSKLQNSVDWAVDKATMGGLKPIAGRAFGHVTGYNLVRKYQAAMLQRSFAMQVARHFKLGQSKMSTGRMADYGLADTAGVNAKMKATIEQHVEFDADGYPTKYNFDKWPPDVKDTFMYSMQRAEATELLRPLVGEMPEWFNKPWMQMFMQFRTMPLVAQNKSLGRSLAFADKEAVAQLMLNAMTAGVVRYGKYAGMAAVAAGVSGSWEDEYAKQLDRAGRDSMLGGSVDKYMAQLGGIADVYSLSHIYGSADSPMGYAQKAANQIPALSLVGDYAGAAYAASQGDGDRALKHAQGIMFLGNTLALEATGSVIEEATKE